MICLRTKLHVPSSSGLAGTASKPKAKETVRTVAAFLFHIVDIYCRNKRYLLFQGLLPYIISGPKSGTGVSPCSQIFAAAVLFLPIAGN